ncbi:MAG: hypothetical protein AAF492_22590, partial [Verrucomicrobiota bacterium]
MISLGLLPLTFFFLPLVFVSAGLLGLVYLLNRGLFGFFARREGVLFSLKAFGLHLLYFLYSGLVFGYCWLEHKLGGRAFKTENR